MQIGAGEISLYYEMVGPFYYGSFLVWTIIIENFLSIFYGCNLHSFLSDGGTMFDWRNNNHTTWQMFMQISHPASRVSHYNGETAQP